MLPINQYPITAFYGIREAFLNRERLEEMKAAGFNLIPLEGSPEAIREGLSICAELGLYATVIDYRMNQAMRMEADWEAVVADIVKDYKDAPALFNYHVMDEPHNRDFPMLRAISDKLLELDPAHQPYINLFPNYAKIAQLGDATYADHVEAFIREVDPTLISYDHYHFCKGKEIESHDFSDERQRLIYENAFEDKNRAGFFDNLETIRAAALAHGLPYMIIILLVEHGPYRYLNEAELRFEVFQSLAYGVNAVSYFTYWTPKGEADDIWHWKEGIISAEGERCRHYEDVKRINPELQRIGTQLLGHRSLAVFHTGECETMTRPFRGYEWLEGVDAPSVTVGFFEGDMALIANKDYKKAATVLLSSPMPLELFDKQADQWIPLSAKALTLEAGDGQLIRIAKSQLRR